MSLLKDYRQLANCAVNSASTGISANMEAASLNADPKTMDEAAIIEERRKRRAEIKAKHMGGVTNTNSAVASPIPDSYISVPQTTGITPNVPLDALLANI